MNCTFGPPPLAEAAEAIGSSFEESPHMSLSTCKAIRLRQHYFYRINDPHNIYFFIEELYCA
ncbi:hypothetical protein CGLO_02109 [Colletotrichum gloeosporioides Cg-14]|uniref:Uncharacterized protein n=1 Tax=Colletotrichum gloeosporioides (strain Cg-14) TaxID=1237896 RepID=T0KZS8_COLGC|nr:hypothetical protein CGLO_02109 [Colletotrichum gloeosporioides Cg-14]